MVNECVEGVKYYSLLQIISIAYYCYTKSVNNGLFYYNLSMNNFSQNQNLLATSCFIVPT